MSFPETTPWPKVRCCWVIYCLLFFLKRKKTFWSEETVDLMHQVFQGAGNSTSALPSAFINKSTVALKQRTTNLLKHWITYLLGIAAQTPFPLKYRETLGALQGKPLVRGGKKQSSYPQALCPQSSANPDSRLGTDHHTCGDTGQLCYFWEKVRYVYSATIS